MLDIQRKDQLVVPFEKIGEENWQEPTKALLEAIADNWDDAMSEPIEADELEKLETRLGISLPESLKTFYLTFGIADVGEQLQPLDEIHWLHETWAEGYAPKLSEEDTQVLPYLITFSDYLGNGNMFCFHTESFEVYYFDHDQQPYLALLFPSVDAYLQACLIAAQADLSTHSHIDQWVEELLEEQYGREVVKKWRY